MSEIRHHLCGDLGRVGRHAARHHAMIAGEHQDLHPVEPRHRAALPARQPHDQILQPAEAAGRLGQLPLALYHRSSRGVVAVRHGAARDR